MISQDRITYRWADCSWNWEILSEKIIALHRVAVCDHYVITVLLFTYVNSYHSHFWLTHTVICLFVCFLRKNFKVMNGIHSYLFVCYYRFVIAVLHWKNKLVVLTTEWLPWLQSWVGYERFLFELETNCTRQPERQLLWSSYNHYPTDSKHYHLREPPACINLWLKQQFFLQCVTSI